MKRTIPPAPASPPNHKRKRLLAATFVHNKFPHRAPPDKGVLRCFMGGANDPAILDASELCRGENRDGDDRHDVAHRPPLYRADVTAV